MKPYIHIIQSTLVILFIFSCSQELTQSNPSVSLSEEAQRLPENALLGVQVADGVKAELFASEPLVRNPTTIDIDHKGRVWVMENVNYRPSANPDNPYQEGGDQIVILEDTDADGKADERKVFFQGEIVDGAMGICVLGNTVIVSCSPHILVFTDEDGDDQADDYEILFTGMGGKQGDHNVHTVSFGPDGKLYFNFGNGSGKMLHPNEEPVVDKMGNTIVANGDPYWGGMVFRCNMDGSEIETLGHNFRNNYEVAVDSYGHMWQSDNDDDGNKGVRINYVMEYGNFGYLDEYTGDSWQTSRSGMHPEIPFRHWHQNDPGVIPNLLHTGAGSPCGLTRYEGDMLPEIYHGALLHADAGPGVVRAYPLQKEGAGFTATIQPLLIRHTDSWYRPTDVCVAPDGSVFGADWYDPGVGGHFAGDPLRGRIYRISTNKDSYHIHPVDLSTPEGAVQALASPNPSSRYMAWTALHEWGKESESALLKMYDSGNQFHRARALWLLAFIDQKYIFQALSDSNPDIKLTAIRIARQHIPDQLQSVIESIKEDPAIEVRREAAIALKEVNNDQVPRLWATLAAQHDGSDRWYLEALGIGASDQWDACFQAWLQRVGEDWNTSGGRDIIWRSRATASFPYLIKILEEGDHSASEQARFLRATDFHNPPNKDETLTTLLNIERKDQSEFQRMLLTHISPEYAKQSKEVRKAVETLLPALEGTRAYVDLVGKLELEAYTDQLFDIVMAQPNHELGVRAANLMIRLEGWDRIGKELMEGDEETQTAIATVLGHVQADDAKELLSEAVQHDELSMRVRKAAVNALGVGYSSIWHLRAVLEEFDIPDELKLVAANKMLSAYRPVDRELGMKYLTELAPGSDQIAPVQELVSQSGDMEQGRMYFQQYCSSCHQVNGEGISFGPELSEIGNKLGRDALYGAIIQPSAGISHGFEGYMVSTKSGENYSGYILSNNDQELTLRLTGGITQSIPKQEIDAMTAMDQSLMTPGLHLAMGEEALIDVVSYLSALKNPETMAENPFMFGAEYEKN